MTVEKQILGHCKLLTTPPAPGLVDEASLYTGKQQAFERVQKKAKGEGRQHDQRVGFALHNPLGSSSEALKSWGIWSAQAVPELLILGVTRLGTKAEAAAALLEPAPHAGSNLAGLKVSCIQLSFPLPAQPPPPPKLRATIEPTDPRGRQEHYDGSSGAGFVHSTRFYLSLQKDSKLVTL